MCKKRKKNKKKKKTKKLSQFLNSHISGTLEAISLKFGMWSAEGGGSVHRKKSCCFIKAAQSYGGAKIAFSFFLSIYSQGCAPASWAAQHTTVCLDVIKNSQAVKKSAAPKKAIVKKDVKSKVAAKKWL